MYATCHIQELLWKALEPIEHVVVVVVVVMTEMALTDRETAVRVLHT